MFRKYLKSRVYHERGQIKSRQHLGFLEKKKDWLKRAENYRVKQKHLRALERKARMRNKDEFKFNMENERTEDGLLLEKRIDPFSDTELEALRTQDIGYLYQKLREESKAIARLESSLHFLEEDPVNVSTNKKGRAKKGKEKEAKKKKEEKGQDSLKDFLEKYTLDDVIQLDELDEDDIDSKYGDDLFGDAGDIGQEDSGDDGYDIGGEEMDSGQAGSSGKSADHVIFLENEKEIESFDAAKYFDTLPVLVGKKYNRLRKDQIDKAEVIGEVEELKQLELSKQEQYRRLKVLKMRREKLRNLIGKMETKKNLQKKGNKIKIRDDNGRKQYVWEFERKK